MLGGDGGPIVNVGDSRRRSLLADSFTEVLVGDCGGDSSVGITASSVTAASEGEGTAAGISSVTFFVCVAEDSRSPKTLF